MAMTDCGRRLEGHDETIYSGNKTGEDEDYIHMREGGTGGHNQGIRGDIRPVTQEEGQVT